MVFMYVNTVISLWKGHYSAINGWHTKLFSQKPQVEFSVAILYIIVFINHLI